MLGENDFIFSSKTRELSLKTVGKVIFFISILSITSDKLLTHKLEGLILSPPNLSKPVINTFIKHLVIFKKYIVIINLVIFLCEYYISIN